MFKRIYNQWNWNLFIKLKITKVPYGVYNYAPESHPRIFDLDKKKKKHESHKRGAK